MASRHFPVSPGGAAAMMALCFSSTVYAADNAESADPTSPFNVSFGVAFKSDAVIQGRSETNGKPAVQPWAEISVNELFYAGYSGSNIDNGTITGWENDFSVGVRPKLGPVNFDFGYTRYTYANGFADESGEFHGRASVIPFKQLTVGGEVAYDPEPNDTYVVSNASLDLTHGFSVSGALGLKSFGDGAASEISWDGGTSWSPGDWATFDLRYYGGPEAGRFVLSLSLSTSASALGIFH
jgi:uncharacterized protein (TIGR02001 family)